jgi:hypothetical protein
MTDKNFIVNDQPTDTDALDFTPRTAVQTLADIAMIDSTQEFLNFDVCL